MTTCATEPCPPVEPTWLIGDPPTSPHPCALDLHDIPLDPDACMDSTATSSTTPAVEIYAELPVTGSSHGGGLVILGVSLIAIGLAAWLTPTRTHRKDD